MDSSVYFIRQKIEIENEFIVDRRRRLPLFDNVNMLKFVVGDIIKVNF